MPLMTFENSDDGILVHVNRLSKTETQKKRFSVTIQDADSGAYLPTVKTFPEQSMAIHYARSIIAGKQDIDDLQTLADKRDETYRDHKQRFASCGCNVCRPRNSR